MGSYRNAELGSLLKDARKYTVFGDVHIWAEVNRLVFRMIDDGSFSSIYLEALKRGNYKEKGDRLKNKRFAYGMNPKKYDELIDRCLSRGLDVHGLDVAYDRQSGDSFRNASCITHWAEYVMRTANGKSLILVGNFHIDIWNNRQDEDFEGALVEHGASKKEILKIVNLRSDIPIRLKDIGKIRGIRLGKYSERPRSYQAQMEDVRRPAHYFWTWY